MQVGVFVSQISPSDGLLCHRAELTARRPRSRTDSAPLGLDTCERRPSEISVTARVQH